MSSDKGVSIKTRKDLWDYFKNQMISSYSDLVDSQKLSSENNLIKSYLLEVDFGNDCNNSSENVINEAFVEKLFSIDWKDNYQTKVEKTKEEGFFEVSLIDPKSEVKLYLDLTMNKRFWFAFSTSGSKPLDKWLANIVNHKSKLDFVWLWPSFLEKIQQRGHPRGFGLDYDYRRFAPDSEDEETTYLKMQLWGGQDTKELYNILKNNSHFKDKIVLSKVRLKEYSDEDNRDLFALQDIKYNGKFTTRGTDWSTHIATLDYVRDLYSKKVLEIEEKYALHWKSESNNEDLGDEIVPMTIQGSAIHFTPVDFQIPVQRFCEKAFTGSLPFRLLAFFEKLEKNKAICEIVDLHSGGKLSMEVYPDIISVYLPKGTCGNSLVRLYTNLQHYFSLNFIVEADSGERIF